MSKRDEEVGRFLVIDAARIGAVDEGVSLQVRIDGAHFFDQARHFFERPLSCWGGSGVVVCTRRGSGAVEAWQWCGGVLEGWQWCGGVYEVWELRGGGVAVAWWCVGGVAVVWWCV